MRLFLIGVIVLAAMLPLAPMVLCAIVVAIGLLAPYPASRPRFFEDVVSDAQPVALLALSLFRAPPARVHFA
ncbi:MAG TPA: hypothetical protein VFV49_11830 [Thermoanaerobaculia bacterium]|nr:hypothetical protein [Thermoanaerobaculia bacterium]